MKIKYVGLDETSIDGINALSSDGYFKGEGIDSFMGMKTCCHCFTPRNGILLLSSLAIIFFIFDLRWAVMTFASGDYKPENDLGISEYGWMCLTILQAIIATMNIITRPLLIIGVIRNSTLLMLPSIFVDFAQISVVGLATCSVFMLPDFTWYEAFVIFLSGLLILFVMIHWFFVLLNYCRYPHYPNSERSHQKTAHMNYIVQVFEGIESEKKSDHQIN